MTSSLLSFFLIEDNYNIFNLETKIQVVYSENSAGSYQSVVLSMWAETLLGCSLFAKQALPSSYTYTFHWLHTSDLSKLLSVTLNLVQPRNQIFALDGDVHFYTYTFRKSEEL